MKIAYVYDAVYPYISGGAERRIWEISRRLVARGHEVHIFGMHMWTGADVITRDGVITHGITRPYRLYSRGRRRIFPSVAFGIQSFLHLSRDRFDIVDCQQFPYTSAFASRVASRLTGSNLVITWHEVWEDYWYRYLGPMGAVGKVAEKVLARFNVPVVAVSETTRAHLGEIRRRDDAKVIPNGVDPAWVDSIPRSEKVSDLIFVGRLIAEKHVDCLIDAVEILRRQNPDVLCMIVGRGPELVSLKERAGRQGMSDNIAFTGTLHDPEEVIARMKASRVFVFPSSREGFGMAVLEAIASGLPVITLDHPDNASRRFAALGCGSLCRLDPEDIAEKVRDTWNRGNGTSERCRRIVRDHDWEEITDSLERFYRQVCGNR